MIRPLRQTLIVASLVFVVVAPLARAEPQVTIEQLRIGSGFAFEKIPAPAKNDLGAAATWTLAEGARDRNGGTLKALHDGAVPRNEDSPRENYFFAAGSDGGRVVVDLGEAVEIGRVSTYSWHNRNRLGERKGDRYSERRNS